MCWCSVKLWQVKLSHFMGEYYSIHVLSDRWTRLLNFKNSSNKFSSWFDICMKVDTLSTPTINSNLFKCTVHVKKKPFQWKYDKNHDCSLSTSNKVYLFR